MGSERVIITGITAVVMAKQPVPGRVKTRLVEAGLFSAEAAAEFAAAMLECIVDRLECRMTVVLAVDRGPDAEPAVLPAGARRTVEQGPGDLGERIDRVWRLVGGERRIVFFGGDSPDVPGVHLDAVGPALDAADVAVGPTDDGGYWALAARRYAPQILRRIDWGSDCVYDQTSVRAKDAGLTLRPLPPWHDVDRPVDVEALRRRLSDEGTGAREPPLVRLASRLETLLQG